jgi:hypothetical protein
MRRSTRYGLALIVVALAVGPTGAGAASAASGVRFTIGSTGAECSLTVQAVSCQTATSARTLSATLLRDG